MPAAGERVRSTSRQWMGHRCATRAVTRGSPGWMLAWASIACSCDRVGSAVGGDDDETDFGDGFDIGPVPFGTDQTVVIDPEDEAAAPDENLPQSAAPSSTGPARVTRAAVPGKPRRRALRPLTRQNAPTAGRAHFCHAYLLCPTENTSF